MFKDLKPYDEYREIGLPWLGAAPAHWRIKRAKNILQPVDVRSTDGREELLTVSSARGVVPRSSATVSMFQATSYVGHKLCWPGDLVINSLWAWGRGLGVSRYHGIVSTAYGVYRPRVGQPIDETYLDLLTRSDAFQWELQVRSRGVWKSRLQLTDDKFLDAPLTVPPEAEQVAIVKYLAHAHRRIDRAIAAKRKLIALLEEQRQVITNQAVTRGLDPTVPFVDTGVPWLGAIPAHWSVKPIGALSSLVQTGPFGSQLHAEEYVSGGVPVINPSHITSGGIHADRDISVTEPTASRLSRHRFKVGDVVIARRGELGRCAVVSAEEEGWVCGTGSLIVRPGPAVDPRYLQVRVSSAATRAELDARSTGATMPNLSAQMVSSLRVPVPPLSEQQLIIETLEREESAWRRSRRVIEAEIALLREFRSRLTSDVVTGQLDVRHIAATLPELDREDVLDVSGTGDDLADELDELMEDVDA